MRAACSKWPLRQPCGLLHACTRRGVAYRSWINAYKVIRGNCNKTDEQASDGAALPAIRAAARDGSDVINLSFGSSFGQSPFVSREYYAAMNTAMRNGSMVVLAGGNDGLIGPWVTDGQLSVSGVISVASAAAKLELPAPLLELSQALRLQNSKPAQASLRECRGTHAMRGCWQRAPGSCCCSNRRA